MTEPDGGSDPSAIITRLTKKGSGYTLSGAKQWIKLTPDLRKRIDTRLNQYAADGSGDIKRLKGRAGVRLRVGDWRVIFYEEKAAIVVVAVGHRRDVYE